MNTVVAADYSVPEAGDVLEIRPGLLWLRMPLPFELDHINLYLIEEESGWAIIDCGLFSPDTLAVWNRVLEQHLGGKPVSRVIVTHAHVDHMGAAGWLCRQHGVPLYTTEREYGYISAYLDSVSDPHELVDFLSRLGMDDGKTARLAALHGGFTDLFSELPETFIAMEQGDLLTIGSYQWQVIVTSGHTESHASLYSDQLGILISGDQVLPRISSNVSVGHHDQEGNPLHHWLTALQQLKQLPGDTLVLPAHNFPFLGLHKRLDELTEEHLEALEQITTLCEAPQTIMDLVARVYNRKLSLFDLYLGAGECLAHANHLMHSGRLVRTTDSQGRYTYQAAKD